MLIEHFPPAETWSLAKGGLSVDAYTTRIRCEAGCPVEMRRAICKAINALPNLLEAADNLLDGVHTKPGDRQAARAALRQALTDAGVRA